jgi:hypothetical protein
VASRPRAYFMTIVWLTRPPMRCHSWDKQRLFAIFGRGAGPTTEICFQISTSCFRALGEQFVQQMNETGSRFLIDERELNAHAFALVRMADNAWPAHVAARNFEAEVDDISF